MGEYLEIRGVSKRFGRAWAVRRVDMTAPEASLTVILGPSGCGKSTLLRIIAGLETPDEGRVMLAGSDITDTPPKDRNIAMVFQDYALYPHMTVERNMTFGLTMRGVGRREARERARRAARLLDIERLLEKKPGTLSGGERQRVAVGRAIVKEPSLFLMDEPLSNVDARLKASMRAEIRRIIAGLSGTMLWVTHDQVEAMTMADTLVVMREGGVEGIGTARELYECPPNLFIASFLGTPPMNLIPEKSGLFERLVGGGRPGRGSDIVAGVRPEDIKVGKGEFVGSVLFFEDLGPERYLTIGTGDGTDAVTLTARVSGKTPRTGDRVSFSIDRGRLSLFDAGTGARIGK
jgi:ABC-type sugar transport system ATPase subunit